MTSPLFYSTIHRCGPVTAADTLNFLLRLILGDGDDSLDNCDLQPVVNSLAEAYCKLFELAVESGEQSRPLEVFEDMEVAESFFRQTYLRERPSNEPAWWPECFPTVSATNRLPKVLVEMVAVALAQKDKADEDAFRTFLQAESSPA